VVEETGHSLQAIAVADYREIGTADNRSTAFGGELPAEPDAIMMRIGITRPAKPMSRETFLNSADYRIDGSPAFACATGSRKVASSVHVRAISA